MMWPLYTRYNCILDFWTLWLQVLEISEHLEKITIMWWITFWLISVTALLTVMTKRFELAFPGQKMGYNKQNIRVVFKVKIYECETKKPGLKTWVKKKLVWECGWLNSGSMQHADRRADCRTEGLDLLLDFPQHLRPGLPPATGEKRGPQRQHPNQTHKQRQRQRLS